MTHVNDVFGQSYRKLLGCREPHVAPEPEVVDPQTIRIRIADFVNQVTKYKTIIRRKALVT